MFNKKNLFFFLILVFFIFIIANPVDASINHRFYGYATDQTGSLVKNGTTITAFIVNSSNPSDVITHVTNVDNSLEKKNYDFNTLKCPDDLEGSKIYFYIGSENTTNDSIFHDKWVNDPNGTDYYNLTIDDMPKIVDNSPSIGSTGDLFVFNVSVFDYVDDPVDLTVKVNWSHGFLGDNTTLYNSAGNFFEGNIVLADSVESLFYTIWVVDSSGNMNSSGVHVVSLVDNDPPDIVSNNCPSSGGTGDVYLFNVSASDNIAVDSVNVSWVHNTLSGNIALSLVSGFWVGDITLDDSISDMIYSIQVNDSSGNFNISDDYFVSVLDNDEPVISNLPTVNPSTGDLYNFTVNVWDNILVSDVFLNYLFENTWNNESMSYSSTMDIYYKNINVPSDASVFTFNVTSVDNSDNWVETGETVLLVLDNDPPEIISDNSPSIGGTGDIFTFSVSASDNIAVDSVNVSWVHNTLSGNIALSLVSGLWTGDITLDTSTEDMVYNLQVNDTSNLFVRGPTKNVAISDNDYPSSSASITSYWNKNTDNPITVNADAYDNDGLKKVSLYYYYSSDNISFSGPYLYDVDNDPWNQISWSFNFPYDQGFYRFYSIAEDNNSLIEPSPAVNDTAAAYDTTQPSSTVLDIQPYWQDNNPIIINANANDNYNEIKYVTLYYLVSTDNSSWTGPYSYGNDNDIDNGISWSFNYPNGYDYHYSFYSIAIDKADNIETPPVTYDTSCFYNNNAPNQPDQPTGDTSLKTGDNGLYETKSEDTDTDMIKYGWDWDNDNNVDTWTNLENSGIYVTSIHNWNNPGTYIIKVKAKDEHGRTSTWSETLTVEITKKSNNNNGNNDHGTSGEPVIINNPPIVFINFSNNTLINEKITFNATKSNDPDGEIKNYSWDFGDGKIGYGKIIIHTYNQTGFFNVTLTVKDNQGLTSTKKIILNISKKPDNKQDKSEIEDESKFEFDDNSTISFLEINGKIYYIADIENDDVPDLFFDPVNNILTNITHKKGKTYLIDLNGNGKYEYEFEYKSGSKPDSENKEIKTQKITTKQNIFSNEIIILTLGIIGVIFATLIAIAILFKIGYLYVEEKPSLTNKNLSSNFSQKTTKNKKPQKSKTKKKKNKEKKQKIKDKNKKPKKPKKDKKKQKTKKEKKNKKIKKNKPKKSKKIRKIKIRKK